MAYTPFPIIPGDRAYAAGLVDDLSGVTNAATARTNLGLGNVDNTSDANKPVSTAQQTALDGKVGTGDSRLSDARTPTDGSVTAAKFATNVLDTDSTMAADSDTRVPSQKAVKAALAGKAPATRTVGTGLGTSGTVNLDMASVNDTTQWITATGALTFTTSNRAAGRSVTLVIDAGGSSRTLTWPSWIPGGAALPTTLASGKRLVVSVMFLDTTDTAASAAAAVQP